MSCATHWGILSIAIVAFDIDEGQKIEYMYPENGVLLSEESKKLVAYLALPHTNKCAQGDIQYCFRYRTNKSVNLMDRYVYSCFYVR